MSIQEPYVIAINRQMGCGGTTIGKQLAEKRKTRYVDREILQEAAKKLAVKENELEFQEEKMPFWWDSFFQFNAFSSDIYLPPPIIRPTSNELFDTEREIIRRIASEGSSVIMGRCAFYILQDHPCCVKIFLHGELEFRKERVQKIHNVSAETASEMIEASDKSRSDYVKAYTGKHWMDARLYDLTIDTSKVGIEKSAAVIDAYIDSL